MEGRKEARREGGPSTELMSWDSAIGEEKRSRSLYLCWAVWTREEGRVLLDVVFGRDE